MPDTKSPSTSRKSSKTHAEYMLECVYSQQNRWKSTKLTILSLSLLAAGKKTDVWLKFNPHDAVLAHSLIVCAHSKQLKAAYERASVVSKDFSSLTMQDTS
jgi:hypothetical protein